MSSHADLVARLLARLDRVRELLGQEPLAATANIRFADALDSMGFVEFLALVAEDCGVPVETIERAAGRRYGSVGELAAALEVARLPTNEALSLPSGPAAERPSSTRPSAWLAATATSLPVHRQPASAINALLHRPPGWLERHAGIEARCLWGDDDPLQAAAQSAQDCLRQAGVPAAAVGVLLVTSEAPPLPIGLAAALHARLGLPSRLAALEIGGACTGFLAALWTGQHFLTETAAVLVIAVEAPSRWLSLSATPAGEAAALFGDAAAACLLMAHPTSTDALSLRDIVLGTDGGAGPLFQIEMRATRAAELHMDGIVVAHRAVRAMTDAVRRVCVRQSLTADKLAAVIAHGGNGRIPSLLARRLGLPLRRVCSETAHTGNLGSASLPVAWALRDPAIARPVIWTAVGAGMQWGAVLFDLL